MKNKSTRKAHNLGLIGYGLLTISLAVLLPVAVSFAQTCVPPPSGLISWWPGEGNANDIVGINNGTLMNGATYAVYSCLWNTRLTYYKRSKSRWIVCNANIER